MTDLTNFHGDFLRLTVGIKQQAKVLQRRMPEFPLAAQSQRRAQEFPLSVASLSGVIPLCGAVVWYIWTKRRNKTAMDTQTNQTFRSSWNLESREPLEKGMTSPALRYMDDEPESGGIGWKDHYRLRRS